MRFCYRISLTKEMTSHREIDVEKLALEQAAQIKMNQVTFDDKQIPLNYDERPQEKLPLRVFHRCKRIFVIFIIAALLAYTTFLIVTTYRQAHQSS